MANPQASRVQCPLCHEFFKSKGMGQHRKYCEKQREIAEGEARFQAAQASRIQDITQSPTFTDHELQEADVGSYEEQSPSNSAFEGENIPFSTTADVVDEDGVNFSTAIPDNEPYPEGDSIKVEYHPSSGLESKTFAARDFFKPAAQENPLPLDPEPEPWLPFRTRSDYEFTKLVLESGMSKGQAGALIHLFQKCIKEGEGSFTLKSHSEMDKTLNTASKRLPKFEKTSISEPYDGENKEFDVWVRPIWAWLESMIQDRELIHHFTWDACHMSRFDKKTNTWTRFYDEPWTGEQFWEIQSKLPPGAKPLVLSIYSDKSKTSTFGTKKAYPVVARCGNLPVELRNGIGIGGGRVVGWLPVIDEDASQTGKAGYVNFKRVIWHKAFFKILESIHRLSKIGYKMECGDGVVRHIYPTILILSADYEEQCIMSLVRGGNGDVPCPVCLVAREKMSTGAVGILRTTETMQDIYNQADNMDSATVRNKFLQSYGLRYVKNVFWDIGYSDPYKAVSFDRLHAYHLGLFEDHIWSALKKKIKDAGRLTIQEVDEQVSIFPSWSGLTHFKSVMNMTFNDGAKYEDFSKISIFVTNNLFEEKSTGYLLLKLLRCYIEIDMYASLELHTEATIAAGQDQVIRFYKLLEAYHKKDKSQNPNSENIKNWNFPKIHSHMHLFDDIIAKGATRNYNTKPNESFHGPFRWDYLTQTNFKNVDEQLLRLNHRRYTITYIQTHVDASDKAKNPDDMEEDTNDASPYLHFGSFKSTTTVEKFADSSEGHGLSYYGFRRMLETFLNKFYKANQLPHETYIEIHRNQEIEPFQYLEVGYKSVVDWKITSNHLRCNPSFHGHERQDCALIKEDSKYSFVRFLRLFLVQVGTQSHALGYVEKYCRLSGPLRRRDKDLGIYRLRLMLSQYQIIPLDSVVRGALIVQDSHNSEEYLIVDTIDGDMFLRMKELIF